MSDVDIIRAEAGSPLLDQAENLFADLYRYMDTRNLLLPLAEGGETIWRTALERTLGRLGILVLAVQGESVVGFAQGGVRIGPRYLGGYTTGVIKHVYVRHEVRDAHLGQRMTAELELWFQEKNVHSCELEVIWQNIEAVGFWERMGFEKELYQMRKIY